jgi:hypothetical protein
VRHVPRTIRALAAATLLVALLAVVALAARGSHPGGHGRVAQRHVPDQVNNDLLTLLMMLYVAGAVGLVVAFIAYKSKWQPVESHWLRDLIIMLVAFALIVPIGYRLLHSRAVHRAAQRNAQLQSGPNRNGRPRLPRKLRRATSGGAHFDSTLALGLLGLIAVGGAIYYVRRRSTLGPPIEPTPDVKAALAAVVSDAIDDLRNEPDARRAVIAAYARMERALARHGNARHPAETPFEYLARILGELNVRARAVADLTDLFEYAKFSSHPVDDLMKERAISALRSVREDLDEPAVAA